MSLSINTPVLENPVCPEFVGCAECDDRRRAIKERAESIANTINSITEAKKAASGFYAATTAAADNTKENTMTAVATAPLKPTASRTSVNVVKTTTVSEPRYTVVLSQYEAGHLIDVLKGHIAGEVRTFLLPIANALGLAGAYRIYADNSNQRVGSYYDGKGYKQSYAVVDFADEEDRENATGIAKKASTF